mmetsp:Transcript_401/g.1095  ORF Transcript_401/g.1095 Transcript_401/m.1095 type:complete len:253 (+) Transcript_401:914-1672(+)
MEENLSSKIIMSEAFLATSVPLIPIDRPTSAAFRAGPSLVPSPVTPTTSPTPWRETLHSSLYPGNSLSFCVLKSFPGCNSSHSSSVSGMSAPFRRCTKMCLSSGLERANTCNLGKTSSSSAGVKFLKSSPIIEIPPSIKIPACLAMATAVSRLSPVTMRTKIPARWHVATASTTSDRRGSMIPAIASKHISFSSFFSHSSTVHLLGSTSFSTSQRWAMATQRSASEANFLIIFLNSRRLRSDMGCSVPSISR